MTTSDAAQGRRRLAILVVSVLLGLAAIALVVVDLPWSPGALGEDPGQAVGADTTGDDEGDEEARAEEERRRAEEEARQREEERLRAEEEARQREEERRIEEERRAEEERQRAEEERLRAEEEERLRAEEEARQREEEQRQAVTAAQQRLKDLGYLIGPVDGKQGQQTNAALMAFQSVNGIQVDGILGPQTTATLASPRAEPSLRGGPGTRIEVDLDRQVLHLVENGSRVVTMKVSSGNGARYSRNDGSTGVANTPVGQFTILRRISGVRESSAGLGTLYDPMYFLGGYALHGSNNVPAGPASHGCVRLSRADAVWLFNRVPNGTPVHLYGGTHVFSR